MSSLVLSHSTEEGTVLRGDSRPYKDVVKSLGLRWYGAGGFWYVPRTRGVTAPSRPLESLAAPLRAAGADVELEGVLAATPEAPAMRVQERSPEERAERLRERAARASAEAEEQFRKSRAAVDGIPFGQPILVGHHSERRHRKAIERSESATGKAVEAYREAQELTRRAESVERRAARSEAGESTSAYLHAEAIAAYVSKNLKRDVGATTVRKQSTTYAVGFYVAYPDAVATRPWHVRIRRKDDRVYVEVAPYMEVSRATDVTTVPVEEVYQAIVATMPRSPSTVAKATRTGPRAPVVPARAARASTAQARIDFDAQLAVGQHVEARWTNGGEAYRSVATVVSLADKSLRVSLDADVVDPRGGGGGVACPAGRVLTLPRFYGGQTEGNGVFALPDYSLQESPNRAGSGSKTFVTGPPGTIRVLRNSEHAPRASRTGPDPYQQRVEPAGLYVVEDGTGGARLPPTWRRLVLWTRKPIVVPFNEVPGNGYDDRSWKARLSREFRARGATLTRKLRSLGFDAVVTVDVADGSTREIVALDPAIVTEAGSEVAR